MYLVDSSPQATSLGEDQLDENFGVEFDDQQSVDGGASEQDKPSKKAPKRARISKGESSAPCKKYVRGKQGALGGIMQMPIEVFTEIASHITPADLITLVRTNKFLRSLLLRRSAILIWQRAQHNAPRLPPLPTGMSEPQYAALIFSKCCTLCGGSATSKPDPWIRVRLCSSCRDTELVEASKYPTIEQYVAKTRFIKLQIDQGRKPPARLLVEEYERVSQTHLTFIQARDHEGLKEWKNRTLAKLKTQHMEAQSLLKYIDSAGKSRGQELEVLKSVRQNEVKGRLITLGWEEKYLDFSDSPDAGQWHSLVRVPKPLTDRIWTNLAPKLTKLLEVNRPRIEQRASRHRRAERSDKLTRLVGQLRESMYPYHEICHALGVEPPGPTRALTDITRALANPFPPIPHVISWDILVDVCDGENSLDQVEELFNERREKIAKRVLEWRKDTESQLVEQYMLDAGGAKAINDVVKINGSTDATESMSPYARFLLRADTVFISKHWQRMICGPPEGGSHVTLIRASYFPAILDGMGSTFKREQELGNYIKHVRIEKVVKALLKDLGMPDAAHVDLLHNHKAFACQKCEDLPSGTWDELIYHYQNRTRQWVGNNPIGNKYMTRHPVPFFHTHRLESGLNSKYLARILPKGASVAKGPLHLGKEGFLRCLLCSGAELINCDCETMGLLKVHMVETHGITDDLVRGLHYVDTPSASHHQSRPTPAWQEKWDTYCDEKDGDKNLDFGS